jgi:hypothetical protein
MIVPQQPIPRARAVRIEILNGGLDKLNHPLTILQPEGSGIAATLFSGATGFFPHFRR